MDNIFVLDTLIQLHLGRNKGKLFALFVDFKRAFDSIAHKLLWLKLYKLGVGSKLCKILIDLYSKANISVKGNSGTSQAIKIMKGVLQGEI